MKDLFLTIALLVLSLPVFAQQVITTDIDNFWAAYDKITATKNSAEQYSYINKIFISKGTPGLKAIMEVRNYTDTAYVEAINNYPNFWNSIRANTLKAKQFAKDIETDILKIKALYPALKPSNIYFTIGALRTGGTTLDGMVLIGSEIALGDSTTNLTELPDMFSHLPPYFAANPINGIVFLNVHEYVHTQQKTTICNTLLGQCIMEGVAEFVAVTATGKASTVPAIAYGNTNATKIKDALLKDLFNPYTGFWLYSNQDNVFATRDLGYYVGYAICQGYYNKAANKKQAIKDMIELDYNNIEELSRFVDASGYFTQPASALTKVYEAGRPQVLSIRPFANGATNVSPAITTITIQFSAVMDTRYRSFEYGPLGEDNVLRLTKFVGFDADAKTATFEIELKPNQHYQIEVGGGFRSVAGVSLKPYLIDFKTGN